MTDKKITNIPYLNITKYANTSGSYDDGIYITFPASKPKHISFQVWTENPNVETCDVRLTSIVTPDTVTAPTTPAPTTPAKVPVGPFVGNFTKVPWQDVVFFRNGYFNYQKMNLVSMVNSFVGKTWYKVDLILDWDQQVVTVYVNGTMLASDPFFTNKVTTIATANAIVIYNLTPNSTCKIM